MPKRANKHKSYTSSRKLAVSRHLARLRKVSSEKDLHQMIRLIGALFPLREDKDTKRDLERLSELSNRKGFKSFYGLLQGILAEDISAGRLKKASDTVMKMFKEESGVDLSVRSQGKAAKGKKKKWFNSL